MLAIHKHIHSFLWNMHPSWRIIFRDKLFILNALFIRIFIQDTHGQFKIKSALANYNRFRSLTTYQWRFENSNLVKTRCRLSLMQCVWMTSIDGGTASKIMAWDNDAMDWHKRIPDYQHPMISTSANALPERPRDVCRPRDALRRPWMGIQANACPKTCAHLGIRTVVQDKWDQIFYQLLRSVALSPVARFTNMHLL